MFWPAARPVTSTSMLSGSFVASASMETVFSWWFGIVSGAGSPTMTIGTSTVVFSPRRTSSRSACSCGARQRVALHGLGQRELLLAVQDDGQQGVGATVAQGRGELAGRQRQVDDVLAVPVQDGGDAAGAAGATGAALAELGAGLGFEAEVSHGGVLLRRWIGSACRRHERGTPRRARRTSITERSDRSLAGQRAPGYRRCAST